MFVAAERSYDSSKDSHYTCHCNISCNICPSGENGYDSQQIVKKDDAQINDNQKQLDNSVKKYQSYKQKESKINDDIKKIQSPKNMQELRSRFASLGYKPI